MDKAEHGARLRAAMGARKVDRQGVVDATGRSKRTVTNWTTGTTMPTEFERGVLRQLFPGYDDPGDPVEVAIMQSKLTEDRQYMLVGTYKRMLREQLEGGQGTA